MPEKYRFGREREQHEMAQRMERAWADEADAREAVQAFNARLEQGRPIWAWPTVAAAITAKHPWVTILCESCDGATDLDLRMKPRPPEASIRVVLRDVKCPRCNGHGRPRITALRTAAGTGTP